MAIAVERIDLPTSLLPTENIFEFEHYVEEFEGIFEAFKMLEII